MSDHTDTPDEVKEIQKPVTVGLYPADVSAVERIKSHYALDSFGQAVRRAIRVMAKVVDDEQLEQAA